MQNKPYSDRFKTQEVVAKYENTEYAPNSYSSYIWSLQREVLSELIRAQHEKHGPLKLLDFACGTGRILSFVESQVAEAVGIDISEDMAQVARTKCQTSQIYVGDILEDANLAADEFNVITCFRFFLNTEHSIRTRVLRELHKRLNKENGILVTNIHGNSRSVRSGALLYRSLIHSERHAQMSPRQIKQMFDECGFEIVDLNGFGILPPNLYRTSFKASAAWLDRTCADIRLFAPISVDLLYVCKPKDV
ncbi:MAG: class I SAM-dependent methyltransferase [Chloroflexota bacterium]